MHHYIQFLPTRPSRNLQSTRRPHPPFYTRTLIMGLGLMVCAGASSLAQNRGVASTENPNIKVITNSASEPESPGNETYIWTGPVEEVPTIVGLQKPGVANLHENSQSELSLAVLEARADLAPEDTQVAFVALEAAAKEGSAEAQYQLAQRYLNAEPPEFSKAAQWLLRAQKQKHSAAELELAKLTLEGKGVPRDPYRAYALIKQAAEKGNNEASLQQGIMLVMGQGTSRNLEEGLPLLTSIPNDETGAIVHWILAQSYSAGNNIPFDAQAAAAHLRGAAQNNHKEAVETLLSLALARSQFSFGEADDSLLLLRQAAKESLSPQEIYDLVLLAKELEISNADIYLGICLARGIGTEKNPEEAAKLLAQP